MYHCKLIEGQWVQPQLKIIERMQDSVFLWPNLKKTSVLENWHQKMLLYFFTNINFIFISFIYTINEFFSLFDCNLKFTFVLCFFLWVSLTSVLNCMVWNVCYNLCVCTCSSLAVPWCAGNSGRFAECPGAVSAGGFCLCAGQVHNAPHHLWVPADLRKA